MKTEIKRKQTSDLPIIIESIVTNLIVLLYNKDSGIALTTDEFFKVGDIIENLSMVNFRNFTGSITLSND